MGCACVFQFSFVADFVDSAALSYSREHHLVTIEGAAVGLSHTDFCYRSDSRFLSNFYDFSTGYIPYCQKATLSLSRTV
jgi:hypothetical protein